MEKMNNNRARSFMQVRSSRSNSRSRSKRGVSPVIGVILMVAATIVIAGVVMGMLGGFKAPKTAPTMNFKLEDADGAGPNTAIKITHIGGDSVAYSDLQYQYINLTTGTASPLAAMPNPGDGIWDIGDSDSTIDPGSPGLYTVRISHLPTGTLIYEGTVRIT